MKTLRKIVLSLLIAAGISNVNLNSMFINSLVLKQVGYGINKSGRVYNLGTGRLVKVDNVLRDALNYAGYNQDSINYDEPEFIDATQDELDLEKYGRTFGRFGLGKAPFIAKEVKTKVQGMYYDLEDEISTKIPAIKETALELQVNVKNAYGRSADVLKDAYVVSKDKAEDLAKFIQDNFRVGASIVYTAAGLAVVYLFATSSLTDIDANEIAVAVADASLVSGLSVGAIDLTTGIYKKVTRK
jgi:hypothetical protein